jgi:glutamate-1-semialdehyde aminotransferase
MDHGFLRELRALTLEKHILLILDEIQCGLARTGCFLAHEPAGIKPDIVTLAKPIAGGLPMGAILLTKDAPVEVKLFFIRAARERLERLHERFVGGEARAALEAMSARFASVADDIRNGHAPPDFISDLTSLIGPLFKEADRSLYNPDVLRGALESSR